ncbi:MAG: SPOR domain-containing protein [Nitrosomonadaceae bacterium]
MKVLFFLLLFANVAFALYTQSGLKPSHNAPLPAEIHPEKIRLLPVTETAPTLAAPACLEWGGFIGTDLQRAEVAIAKLQLDDTLDRHTVGEVTAYWVHIPPLKTKQDADKKIDELKKLGVANYFLIQDSGEWNNAISLDIFRGEEAARKFLAEMKGKGIRSAVIGERSLKQVAFVAHKPSDAIIEKMVSLKQSFPGSELKASECGSTAPPP